ncbi:hypothetical protein ONZ43_g5410 [Nemania bipapillata]|uniref:Uncharacterized protein n=1 Tax=Nemania bipapillata TaxID=110536 RepID=A0ACC2IBB1_9PEZI|nr:hypothetical protein ONZ43_g5410 [Nemania bipapillata]
MATTSPSSSAISTIVGATSNTSPTPTPASSASGLSSTGVAAGIGAGASVAALTIIRLFIFWLLRRKFKSKRQQQQRQRQQPLVQSYQTSYQNGPHTGGEPGQYGPNFHGIAIAKHVLTPPIVEMARPGMPLELSTGGSDIRGHQEVHG